MPENNKIKTILILGGYGNAGRCIAQHLVRETTTTTIIIAGRDGDRAKQVALELGLQYNCPDRIRWRRVDATDTNSLDEAFSMSKQQQDDDDKDEIVAAFAAAVPPAAVNMVVVASSTTSCAKQVAEAALRHHVNYYFDIQLSSKDKIHDLTALEEQIIQAANACFVTDGGVHPGVPGALVRYAQAQARANNEDNTTASSTTTTTTTTTMAVHCANVYLLFRPNWKEYKFSPATQKEFIKEMCEMPPMLYRNGAWVNTGWTCTPTFDFGSPFGKETCMPMYLQELKNITDQDNQQVLQEMGVYVTGFNPVTDYIILPLVLLVFFILPKRVAGWLDPVLAGLFQWSLSAFSKPPYGGKIVMEAVICSTKYQSQLQNDDHDNRHRKTRLRLELTHHDVYEATAIPAVATILQMLDYNVDDTSSSPSPPLGLQYQAQLVEPRRFLKDMQRLGMEIKEEMHNE